MADKETKRHKVMLTIPQDKYEALKREAERLGLPVSSFCTMRLAESLEGQRAA